FYAAGDRDGGTVGPDPKAVDSLLVGVAPTLFSSPAVDEAGQVGRFLTAAAPPFLLLLLAPALLPAAFPRVPRSAPEILISRDRAGPAMGRTMSVASNPLAYAISVLAWITGIALGILVIYAAIRFAGSVGGWLPIPGEDSLSPGHASLLRFALVFVLFYAV